MLSLDKVEDARLQCRQCVLTFVTLLPHSVCTQSDYLEVHVIVTFTLLDVELRMEKPFELVT
jgi:hypothetical protein